MNYLGNFFNESLRHDAPATISLPYHFHETIQVGPFKIAGGDNISLNIKEVHFNPN